MNNYKNNLIVGRQALLGMMNGITIAADAVRGTLGAGGQNAVIEQDFEPYHIITNDGATIIENIYLEDPLEKRGLAFLKEVVDRSNKNAGDGSTTTVILLEAILKAGLLQEKTGMEIKRSIDELLPVIEQEIDRYKREITVEDVHHVATISTENETLGNLLGEIYKNIGKDGIIHPEYVLGTDKHTCSYIEGVRFARTGYLSPVMVYDEEARKEGRKETKAVYENPVILVTKKKISHVNDINPLLNQLKANDKKDLVIFTSDMDSGVASLLIELHKNKLFNILIIKAPILWSDYVYEDFAKCVGATVVEDASGINTFKKLQVSHLGTCGKIIVDKDETVLMGTQDISEHIDELKKEGSNDSLLRLSWLTTKTALLKIGAQSDTELSYLRLKIEDAVNACKLALEDGIVMGGGVTLFNVARLLPETLGGNVLSKALKEPLRQIILNSGKEPKDIGLEIPYDRSNTKGYDAKTHQIVDMWEANIVDPAKVVKNAVKNAVSIASTILTSSVAIHKMPMTPEQMAYEMAMKSNQRPF